jgi:secreted PhoX family phosphatase
MWYIPLSGNHAGECYPFALSPMETESTGPFFTADQKTLFLSIQHPGELYGMRQNMASETREFSMMTTDGQEFMQKRIVPIGSNWPGKGPNDPPKPSVVAIHRVDRQPLV